MMRVNPNWSLRRFNLEHPPYIFQISKTRKNEQLYKENEDVYSSDASEYHFRSLHMRIPYFTFQFRLKKYKNS